MLTWICFDETTTPNITKWLQRELCSDYSLAQRATYHITLENNTGQSVTRVTQYARLTTWMVGKWRNVLVSLQTWHIAKENSLPGGEEEGGAGW
jgi:uncharacterized protein YerC